MKNKKKDENTHGLPYSMNLYALGSAIPQAPYAPNEEDLTAHIPHLCLA